MKKKKKREVGGPRWSGASEATRARLENLGQEGKGWGRGGEVARRA